jgi:hypothetical protein
VPASPGWVITSGGDAMPAVPALTCAALPPNVEGTALAAAPALAGEITGTLRSLGVDTGSALQAPNENADAAHPTATNHAADLMIDRIFATPALDITSTRQPRLTKARASVSPAA